MEYEKRSNSAVKVKKMGSPSVQHRRATPFLPPKSVSSAPKTLQFNTSSVQHILQFYSPDFGC